MDSDQLFDRIEEIAFTPEKMYKMDLMRGVIGLKPVLYYAYDPMKKFGIRGITEVDIKGHGFKKFDKTTWGILYDLARKKGTTNSEKRRVLNYAASLSPKSCELFIRILRKDLRAGINRKLANKVFPGLITDVKVMLANVFNFTHLSVPCFSSIKYNGNRGTYRNGQIYSREGRVYKGLDHIIKELKGGQAVDGELLVPGVPFDVSSGMVRDDNPSPMVVFYAFDLPDSALPFDKRYLQLLQYTKKFTSIVPVEHKVLIYRHQVHEEYRKALAEGHEGVVIKGFHHYYQHGYSYHWMKIKPVFSAEVKVKSVYIGSGKYSGMLGGVHVDFKGVDVKVGSGFSDLERIRFWKDRKSIVNRTVVVEFSEVNKSGSMRHPRFNKVL